MKQQTAKTDMRAIAQRAHRHIEIVLWASLFAFVLYFAAVVAPQIPESRAIQQAAQLHAIAEEQDYYCEKWGKSAGSREHALCVLDLQQYRAAIERELSESNSF
jgi:hypothetical protein